MSWDKTQWSIVITEDGSPSLRFKNHEHQELMHHSGGAYSESLYVYGRTLPLIRFKVREPKVMSLGLGLGYNELIVAEYCYYNQLPFFMVSYEKDPFLKESLLIMLGLSHPHSLSFEIQKTYQKVFSFFSEPCLWTLKQAYLDRRWILRDALTPEKYESQSFHLIFWDAFSRKTSPELWDEGFLTHLFKEVTDSKSSVISTYACNGPMKRSLKANQFQVTETPGFQNKRRSILATRFRESDADLSNV